MPISDYFERMWLSPNSRFSREVWNQYDNVLNTSELIEQLHRRIPFRIQETL